MRECITKKKLLGAQHGLDDTLNSIPGISPRKKTFSAQHTRKDTSRPDQDILWRRYVNAQQWPQCSHQASKTTIALEILSIRDYLNFNPLAIDLPDSHHEIQDRIFCTSLSATTAAVRKNRERWSALNRDPKPPISSPITEQEKDQKKLMNLIVQRLLRDLYRLVLVPRVHPKVRFLKIRSNLQLEQLEMKINFFEYRAIEWAEESFRSGKMHQRIHRSAQKSLEARMQET